jgi:hypothetical protein
MSKSVNDLLRKYDNLRSKYSARDTAYEANWYAYKGEYDRIYEYYSSDALALSHRRTETNIQKWNLIRPIVDTHRLLLARMPSIEVPAPELADELMALKADKEEKILYALWDTMRMKRKHGEAGFHLALNEAMAWQIAWDAGKEIPIIYVRSPGETYPVMKRGGDEVSYCFFRWEEDTEELAERYPEVKPLLTRNRLGSYAYSKIEVVEYVDETERLMIVNGDVKSLLKEGGAHQLGCCPVIITAAINIPGEIFPPTKTEQLVPMNDHINRFQTKLSDAVEEVLFGHHVVEGDGANDVPIPTGPGQVIRLEGPNLKYHYDQPQAPPGEAFGHIEQANRHMRNLGLWPEVASGETDASIITGKAVTRLQGLMAAQGAETMDNMADGLARANSICLKMLETYRPDKKYELYATEPVTASSAPGRKRNFGVSFVPKEDINGFYLNALHYSPFGADFNQSMQLGMQLVDARIASRSWMRNLIPGMSDAEGMAAEIKEEDRERAQFEADLQVEVQRRILQAQTEQQAQLQQMAAQAQGQGGTGASAPAPVSGNAPTPPGGLPPGTNPTSPGGEIIGGNAMLMPGGQPQMLGLGEPLTGAAESFPIPYTPLKPYGPAVAELAGTGVHGQAANEAAASGGLQGEAMPGKNVIKAEDIAQALEGAVNRQGVKATDKIKGEVYLMGDLATRGWTDGKVELGITVKSDQQILTTALPQYAAMGILVFREVKFKTPEDAQAAGAVLIVGPPAKE